MSTLNKTDRNASAFPPTILPIEGAHANAHPSIRASCRRVIAVREPRGFTLLELVIAVAVVGILAAIAFPSYQSYLKRAHRSAVQSLMLDLANREQQYLLDNRAFLGGDASALIGSGVPTEVSNFYSVTIDAPPGSPPTFLITAAPKAGTVIEGEAPFTLDQDGTKLPADKWQGR